LSDNPWGSDDFSLDDSLPQKQEPFKAANRVIPKQSKKEENDVDDMLDEWGIGGSTSTQKENFKYEIPQT